jgi:hypothetical protein
MLPLCHSTAKANHLDQGTEMAGHRTITPIAERTSLLLRLPLAPRSTARTRTPDDVSRFCMTHMTAGLLAH